MGLLTGVTIDKIDLGGIFTGFKDLIQGIGDMIRGHKIIDEEKMVELQVKLAELEMKGRELEQAIMLAQARINEIEAASPKLFVSGWRPATGWLCVTGLAWQIFVWPLWVWAARLFRVVEPPSIEVAILVTLLIGMLGLGTLRTVEKTKDVASK